MGRIRMDLYLKGLKIRYHRSNRAEKSQLLNEFCATSGCHRKHAIRLMNTGYMGFYKPTGRKKYYDPVELQEPLKKLWLLTDQSCGKRLKSALPLWLPAYERHYGELSGSSGIAGKLTKYYAYIA